MDHFALPDDDLAEAQRDGSLQRNFQGYSTHWHCELIGLGVSSIGSIGNVYAQNAVKTQDYEELIESGTLPVRKGMVVDYDDQIRSTIIQSLMCYDKLSFSQIERAFDIRFREYFANELASLDVMEADGLLERGKAASGYFPAADTCCATSRWYSTATSAARRSSASRRLSDADTIRPRSASRAYRARGRIERPAALS